MDVTKIFVSYSWIEDSPDVLVLKLVSRLRSEGYFAECDIMKMQEKTAINFVEMMSASLMLAQKVIIVLSRPYKDKADTFKGGVGEEYRYIISDISRNANKYILTTFDEDIPSVLPDFLNGREVIKISDQKGWDKLLHKINCTGEYIFPEVNQHRKLPDSTYISDELSLQTTNISKPDLFKEDVTEYYCLLVSSHKDAWENDFNIIEMDRCLTTYTSPEVKSMYDIQKAEVISRIKKHPCIFAYENYLNRDSYIGYITDMVVRNTGIKFIFKKTDIITYAELNQHTFELDIDMKGGYTELGHTHWTIKRINLYKEFPFKNYGL